MAALSLLPTRLAGRTRLGGGWNRVVHSKYSRCHQKTTARAAGAITTKAVVGDDDGGAAGGNNNSDSAAAKADEDGGDVDVEGVRIALGLLDKRISIAVREEDFATAAKLRDEKTATLGALSVDVQILITRLDRLCNVVVNDDDDDDDATSEAISDQDRAVAANALMEARDRRALPSLAATLRVSPGGGRPLAIPHTGKSLVAISSPVSQRRHFTTQSPNV